MKERGIIFNGDMVRAILSGKKTQTRRVVKGGQIPTEDASYPHGDRLRWSAIGQNHPRWGYLVTGRTEQECAAELELHGVCPFGQPGDRLWVRETFGDCGVRLVYRADTDDGAACQVKRWTPSIHMPKAAARILLEITDVRVERLNDISEQDADAEGCERLDSERENRDWNICPQCGGTGLHDALGANHGVIHDVDCQQCDTYAKRFKHLWQSIYGQESWDGNPWVWVVEFKQVSAVADKAAV